MAKRKTKKEDAGSTYGEKGQEDQFRGAKERTASSSVEPALGQSTKEEVVHVFLLFSKQKQRLLL